MAREKKKNNPDVMEDQATAAEPVESTETPDAEASQSQTDSPEITALKDELKKALTERDQYLDMAQRSRAEFDNYRRRTETQRGESLHNGIRDTITQILPVIDNMERAFASSTEIDDTNPLKKGVEMVHKQFMETLTNIGLEKIDALGAEFDPNFHHAVMEGEATDEFVAGTVMEVMQEGYIVKDKIIRYAMVKVAK